MLIRIFLIEYQKNAFTNKIWKSVDLVFEGNHMKRNSVYGGYIEWYRSVRRQGGVESE